MLGVEGVADGALADGVDSVDVGAALVTTVLMVAVGTLVAGVLVTMVLTVDVVLLGRRSNSEAGFPITGRAFPVGDMGCRSGAATSLGLLEETAALLTTGRAPPGGAF